LTAAKSKALNANAAKRRASRYLQIASNAGLALSSFCLAYLLLQYAPSAHYGHFAFILVLQAFGMALCNALVASPLLIIMNQQLQQLPSQSVLKGYLLLGTAIASVVAVLQGLYLWWAFADGGLSVCFALAGGLQLIRWYGRCEWQNRDVRVLLRSDLLFTGLIFIGAATLWGSQQLTLQHVAWLLLLASFIAIMPFITGFYAALQANTDWQAVRLGFRQQGKPALFGVLTVEATANFHSYLVVLSAGSIAFAPIAAAMLFFRPLAVVLGSLQQSDRPLLVQALHSGELPLVLQIIHHLRKTALSAFFCNALIILLVYLLVPNWLWPQSSTRTEFAVALLLWSLIALCRALRSSATALMQAADQFAPLARATYWSAALTIPAVLCCWWLAGPVASLLGVLSGEIVLGFILLRAQQQLLADAASTPKSVLELKC
jgi:hypothetical protein